MAARGLRQAQPERALIALSFPSHVRNRAPRVIKAYPPCLFPRHSSEGWDLSPDRAPSTSAHDAGVVPGHQRCQPALA